MSTPKKLTPKKDSNADIAKTYVKYDQITHVRTRPGMYIGSIDMDTTDAWVLNTNTKKMEKRRLEYVPGLFKIFDEILVNASDHEVRLKSKKPTEVGHYVKTIRVNIDKTEGTIEVSNDGDGIDVVMHPEEKIYVPELIFANLLSSTNYDDTEDRVVGGQNGLGGKCANIFSSWFEVETVDATRKLHYVQRYENNMTTILPPVITRYTKKPYTTIRFKPDYASFKQEGLTDDMYDMMVKRVYDMCAVTGKDVTVYFNNEKIDCKTFEKYVDLYIGTKSDHTRVYEEINDRWEVVASYNDSQGFEQISFVNGIWTIRGGKHVEYILNQITKKLVDMISKKNKDLIVRPQTVKDNLILFVKSTIVNPTFDSQSKETLTTPVSKFGSKAEISEKFVEKLYKSGIVQRIVEISQIQGQKDLKKTDGKKRKTIRGIHKLDDANWAGTDKSKECTLILTEGDSAKTMAIAGLSKVGRDRYGVFPLRGKLMNVKEATDKKIMENEEISNLKKILGLESGKEYKTLDDLRYGKIMIMTDQDVDGSHIKGLIFNMFHALWPSLVKDHHHFLTSMMTPIVKASKGKTVMSFYNLTDFENWRASDGLRGWTIKYYKGLGTSTEEEALEYFHDLKTVSYVFDGQVSEDSIDLAFNKKRADDRKEWLGTYDRQEILDIRDKSVTYDSFVHKELKHFSNYDLERSIPNIVDGLKTSLRKIVFSCFKKNIYDKEIKVAQLAGYVSENSAYHHGEASLQGAIVGLAQDFVGSNNLNILLPKGQFGSRVQGGKDASQPRYIFTMLNPVVETIFKKEDMKLLTYKNDDGDYVEPEYYVPIIPMILVNGSVGIGTGFSTNIPCYNPKDIVAVLRKMLRGEDVNDELVPWYCGFTGKIERKSNGTYESRGTYRRISPTKVEITELPIGTWTEDFKKMLEMMLDEKDSILRSYDSNYTHLKVHFTLHFTSPTVLDQLLEAGDDGVVEFESRFKLVSSKPLSTSNMHLFNAKCQIQKYNTPVDIIRDYYVVRLQYYSKRKMALMEELLHDIRVKENKIRFIKETIAKVIDVSVLTKKELEACLEQRGYMMVKDNYHYLIEIPIYKQTKDEVHKLEMEIAQCKLTYEDVEKQSPQAMWEADLDVFEKQYNAYTNARLEKYAKSTVMKKSKST